MKSLSHIKALYAQEKHFKSWEHFCSMANDAMFIQAIDDVARLLVDAHIGDFVLVQKKNSTNTTLSKRNKRSRKAYRAGF